MKLIIIFLTLLPVIGMSQELSFAYNLYNGYENYKEPSLSSRRIKYDDILPLIENLRHNQKFVVHKVGESAEKRSLFLIKIGSGPKRIFLWSQMHGDESTATMALFDLFNFFSANDHLNELRNKILQTTTLYFLPMVNPDGAELFQRRNSWGIDLNRDAKRLATPEANILMQTFDSLEADFGFNLHDQKTRYSVGKSFRQATLSFLAPAYDDAKDMNESRERAVKVIGGMNEVLQQFIPGHIAKYNDDFEARAFGDNFQKKGTSTILIESGGWKNDDEKQFIRKLNFIAMASAFLSIANESYASVPIETYNSIPFNDEKLFDLLLTDVSVDKLGKPVLFDIGINSEEKKILPVRGNSKSSSIEDLGDLSGFFGITEMNCDGLQFEEAKNFSSVIKTEKELNSIDFDEQIKNGVAVFTVAKNILEKAQILQSVEALPVKFIETEPVPFQLQPGTKPFFYLYKNGAPKYLIARDLIIRVNE